MLRPFSIKRGLAVFAVLLGLGLVCCGKESARKEIVETRTVPPATAPEAPPPSTLQPPASQTGALQWTAPEGWAKAPPTAMRTVNFKVGPAPEAECYATVLKGAAGGLELNINRWRIQMGQEDRLTEEDITKLPQITLSGQQVPLIEATGSFTGMDGEPRAGYMLLGAIGQLDGRSLFVKMVGPEATVRAQKDNFILFCESFK